MTVGYQFTYTRRIVPGFTGAAVILTLIPNSTALLPAGANYWVSLGLLFIYGAFSGVTQGTVYAIRANMPFKYMGAVMFGSGRCGICCSFLRVIS